MTLERLKRPPLSAVGGNVPLEVSGQPPPAVCENKRLKFKQSFLFQNEKPLKDCFLGKTRYDESQLQKRSKTKRVFPTSLQEVVKQNRRWVCASSCQRKFMECYIPDRLES